MYAFIGCRACSPAIPRLLSVRMAHYAFQSGGFPEKGEILSPIQRCAQTHLSRRGERSREAGQCIAIMLERNAVYQCLKWRFPVKTMAIPCLSAAAMTSPSFLEPPG